MRKSVSVHSVILVLILVRFRFLLLVREHFQVEGENDGAQQVPVAGELEK